VRDAEVHATPLGRGSRGPRPYPYARKCSIVFSSATGASHSDQVMQPHTFVCRYKYNPRSKVVGKTLQKDPRPTEPTEEDNLPATDAPAADGAAAAPAAAAPAAAAPAGPAATADLAPAKKARFDAKKSYEALEQEVLTLKATVSTLQGAVSNVLAKLARVGAE